MRSPQASEKRRVPFGMPGIRTHGSIADAPNPFAWRHSRPYATSWMDTLKRYARTVRAPRTQTSRQFEDRAAIHAAAVLPKSGLGTKMPRPSMTTEAFWNLQENSPAVTLLRRAKSSTVGDTPCPEPLFVLLRGQSEDNMIRTRLLNPALRFRLLLFSWKDSYRYRIIVRIRSVKS